jgi:hypothetical protein
MLPHKPYIYLASVQTYTDLEIWYYSQDYLRPKYNDGIWKTA